jgi:hypothetical protein
VVDDEAYWSLERVMRGEPAPSHDSVRAAALELARRRCRMSTGVAVAVAAALLVAVLLWTAGFRWADAPTLLVWAAVEVGALRARARYARAVPRLAERAL